MDYSGVRWTEDPAANLSDTNAALRTLNIVNIVPVDLNAILFRNYEVMSMMYSMIGNSSRSEYWSNQASTTREAILVSSSGDLSTTEQKAISCRAVSDDATDVHIMLTQIPNRMSFGTLRHFCTKTGISQPTHNMTHGRQPAIGRTTPESFPMRS